MRETGESTLWETAWFPILHVAGQGFRSADAAGAAASHQASGSDHGTALSHFPALISRSRHQQVQAPVTFHGFSISVPCSLGVALQKIGFVAIVSIATVGAMVYYSLTVLWPTIIGAVYTTNTNDIGWQSSVVGGGVLLGQIFGGLAISFVPKVKWQCVECGSMRSHGYDVLQITSHMMEVPKIEKVTVCIHTPSLMNMHY